MDKNKDNSTCKWCGKAFKNERTLITHMCVKKLRWADKDMTHVRLAHRVFHMFHEYTTNGKPKSMEDFIRSPYYTGFVKFGRACMVNEYLYPEKFAEWLIRNGVKLDDWPKDKTYDKFMMEYVKKEPGLKALERTIIYLAEWEADTGNAWNTYFQEISTNRAVHDIRAAKISPWVIYLSETGRELMVRMNDEQIKIINHIIDAEFWAQVFVKNAAEVEEIQSTCQTAKL